MADLPARPSLDRLRREARDLLRAAQSGDPAAVGRIRAVSDAMTLASAQLALAREYGYVSWARLKTEVSARTTDLARLAEEFCVASIRDGTGRAVRMLAATPQLADYGFATAVILGDARRVRAELSRDPGLATRAVIPGWSPLHLACASRWFRLDPARADGLAAVTRILLDAGADPFGPVAGGGWTPLRCAVAGAANPAIVSLLLERGAVPNDHDLYLAGFGGDDHQSLRLLLAAVTDVPGLARMALAAPISLNDTEGVRLLLAAGADPRRYHDDDDQPCPVAYAAVRADCSAELIGLLLAHGAEPDRPGPDGRSPYTLAILRGRDDLDPLADVLRRHGAADDTYPLADTDRFLGACLRADQDAVQRLLAEDPGLAGRLTDAQRAEVLIRAAETGNMPALRLMLDIGFPIDARGEHGGTVLHAAAYSGSSAAVRVLLDRGADLEARDATWNSTPLDWAVVGSGGQPADNPQADWMATASALLEAGASIAEITLSPDDPKAPSSEVADLLRRHGVADSVPG
jgi:ankyrin repeat protein